jgi:septal ring factor EnvC (AmiA/AmiB activator)
MGIRGMVVLALGTLLVGVLAGYFMWGLPTRDVARELADARTQLSNQGRRTDELQSKLAETESELKRAAEGLKRERDLREKFEDMVNKGQK